MFDEVDLVVDDRKTPAAQTLRNIPPLPSSYPHEEKTETRKLTIADVRLMLGEDDLLRCFGEASDFSLAVFQPWLQYMKLVEQEIHRSFQHDPSKLRDMHRQLKALGLQRRPFVDSLIVAARDQVEKEQREEWDLDREVRMKGKRELLAQSLVRRDEVDKLVEEAVRKAEQRVRDRLGKELQKSVAEKVKQWLLLCLPHVEQGVVEKVVKQISREAVVVEDEEEGAEDKSGASRRSAPPEKEVRSAGAKRVRPDLQQAEALGATSGPSTLESTACKRKKSQEE